jgi:hypothetical protein
LELILDRTPNSKIIFSGDFNEQRQKVEELCRKRCLSLVIQEGTPIHNKGNHLDQIFTNLVVNLCDVGHSEMTDHAFIRFKFSFTKSSDDIDIRKMPVKITSSEIRKQANSEQTINKLIS